MTQTGTMASDGEWRITKDGKRYETLLMAARRLGLTREGMKSMLKRAKDAAADPEAFEPAGHLDDRTPVYLQSTINAAKAAGPGRGVPAKRASRKKD